MFKTPIKVFSLPTFYVGRLNLKCELRPSLITLLPMSGKVKRGYEMYLCSDTTSVCYILVKFALILI